LVMSETFKLLRQRNREIFDIRQNLEIPQNVIWREKMGQKVKGSIDSNVH
jgi:hypothetical protein